MIQSLHVGLAIDRTEVSTQIQLGTMRLGMTHLEILYPVVYISPGPFPLEFEREQEIWATRTIGSGTQGSSRNPSRTLSTLTRLEG